ncbi:sucrase ferredoxin [Propionibacterium australiense]|uniref:Thioredoxin-like fold n=1 Tax=Propionibacterium australiense TaxID=119981 RepID=A0A383S431_9ACTN|nr:sucrase ferredoxin [Propionibacterium australiense]RLP12425.1 hypothetical protein D9T14_00835 [Propionibacterium australiense]SYZ32760.1 Thioredoxin-like fold [Propionibacterium australiense]VEH91398.1 Uncharacterized protein conserved in bacteria containing thioredoxin-like domain [Propionibacterium australiense]
MHETSSGPHVMSGAATDMRSRDERARDRHAPCSTIARASGEQLIATATPYDRFVLVEVQAPWPDDMRTPPWMRSDWSPERVGALNRAIAGAEAAGVRAKFVALAPDRQYSVPGNPRAIILERHAGHCIRWVRQEFFLGEEDGLDQMCAVAGGPLGQDGFRVGRVRELLICAHGQVDSCCGRLGVRLHRAARQMLGGDTTTRVWRCSAIGGHRFAPTALDFPSGRMWGHLVEDDLPVLLTGREIDPIWDRYRGAVGLDTRAEQAVEGELLRRYGPALVDAELVFRVEDGYVDVSVDLVGIHDRYRMVVITGEPRMVVANCKGMTSPVTPISVS